MEIRRDKSLLDRFYEVFLLWAGADRPPDVACYLCDSGSPVVRGKVGVIFRTKYYHKGLSGYVRCTFPAKWILNPYAVPDRL